MRRRQLIQHFDSDHNLRLDTTELAAAEAFLTAGFPDMDIAQLEGKAASGGVTIADLEPLLLEHLGAGLPKPPQLAGPSDGGGLIEVVVEAPAASTPPKRSLFNKLSA